MSSSNPPERVSVDCDRPNHLVRTFLLPGEIDLLCDWLRLFGFAATGYHNK